MPLYVQRIADLAVLKDLTSEWEEIDGLSCPRTPFTSPIWNLLWWRHFRENRLWVRDELFVLAVRDEHGTLIALAPLMRSLRPAWGPLRVREIQFFGADPNVTELRTLVCRPGYRSDATRVLHAHLMEEADDWDSFRWCGIPVGESVEALGAPPPYHTVTNYYLRLQGSWPELISGLSRNMKEALRKCYNSLKRGGHVFTLQVISNPEEVDAALDNFFKLHRDRSELKRTVPHPNTFKTARSQAFLRDYVQHMAQRDQLRIFQLKIDGHVVATRIGFVLGEEIYLYYSGYLPAWGKYSVMTTLTAECMKWALERRFKIVNLSTGNDYAKTRWQPIEAMANDYLIISPAARNRFVQSKLLMLRSAQPESILGRAIAIARRGR